MTWLVALIVLLLPTYLIRFSLFGVPTTFLEATIYIAALALLGSRPFATVIDVKRQFLRRFGLPLLLIVLGTIVGFFATEDTRQALGLVKAYIIDPVIFAVLLCAVVINNIQWRRVLWALLIGGGLVGLSAALLPLNAEGRAIGIYQIDSTASPNFIALFLAPLIPLALHQFLTNRKALFKLSAAIATLAMGYGLWLSGSRGGLMAAAVGIAVLVLWWAMQQQQTVRRVGQVGMVLLIAGSLFGGYLLGKPDLSTNPDHRVATSNNLRYEIWKTTVVDLLPEHWLIGTGIGHYQESFTELTKNRINYPEFIAPWAHTPHNIFLTVWVNLGIFGLIGFIWLIVEFFRLGWPHTKNFSPALALQVSMITLLVHGLVDSPFWKNDLAVLFWVLVGLQFTLHEMTKEPHAKAV